MSVTVNNNNPVEDYVHLDDQTQPTFEMTPGFKPFTTWFSCKMPIGQELYTTLTPVMTRCTSSIHVLNTQYPYPEGRVKLLLGPKLHASKLL